MSLDITSLFSASFLSEIRLNSCSPTVPGIFEDLEKEGNDNKHKLFYISLEI